MQTELLIDEIAIRLCLALFAGIVLGLNRWIHHKAAGVRTHTLVSVGAALAILLMGSIIGGDAQAQSHVLQGIVSGIGFLGAGIILHRGNSESVKGLTTAASIWVVAIIGCCYGAGQLLIGSAGLAAIIFILILGRPLELAAGKLFGIKQTSETDQDLDKDQ
jgi:putative Mg2+ transporter-C (MgtC) family protein